MKNALLVLGIAANLVILACSKETNDDNTVSESETSEITSSSVNTRNSSSHQHTGDTTVHTTISASDSVGTDSVKGDNALINKDNYKTQKP